jgi:hypothetical protein
MSSTRSARLVAPELTVQQAGLGDLAPDPLHRVERELRVLQDHRDAAAADVAPARGAFVPAGRCRRTSCGWR